MMTTTMITMMTTMNTKMMTACKGHVKKKFARRVFSRNHTLQAMAISGT